MPKVTGYKLREAIKQWSLKKDALERLFEGSLKAWPGETKDPAGALERYLEAELAIVRLQDAQGAYNQKVEVELPGIGKTTLAFAVKALGPLGRYEKMWRKASGDKADPWDAARSAERDPAKVYAFSTITPEAASERSLEAAKRAAAVRSAVALANATEVKLDLPSGLLD